MARRLKVVRIVTRLNVGGPTRQGVDPLAVAEIQGLIRRMKQRSLGILITDHNVRETLQLCDRAYVIAKGERIKDGTPTEIISDAKVREVYLGNTFDTPVYSGSKA